MARKTDKMTRLVVPIDDGILNTNVELTLVASQEIEGQTFVNQMFTHVMDHWNDTIDPPSYTTQGLLEGADVSPVASVNEMVSVGRFSLVADNSGTVIVSPGGRVSLTRDATKRQVQTITVNAATGSIGVISVISGVASVASEFSSTYGDDAGPALLSVGKLGVFNAYLVPGSSAAVAGTELSPLLPDNTTLMVEFSDIPGGEVINVLGGVLFNETLLDCHVGKIPRKVYATFRSQKFSMQRLADLLKMTINETGAVIEMPACEDIGSQAAPSDAPKRAGTLEKYAVDFKTCKMVGRKRTGFIRWYRDSNVLTKYQEIAVVWTSRAETLDKAAASTESVGWTGNGPMLTFG